MGGLLGGLAGAERLGLAVRTLLAVGGLRGLRPALVPAGLRLSAALQSS